MGFLVGIDLGTTHSLCAVFKDGRPELVPNAAGSYLTPSVVGFLEDGRTLVGSAARELAVTRPERAVACFKRWMGTDRTTVLGDVELSPVELSGLVLRSLKEDAEAWLGGPVTDAVITVPAYFNDHQREATRLAGVVAGLEVRRIVNEPTAAALTYGFHDRDVEKKVLVFDLGGGTFDVTLMEVFEGTLEIVSTAGESHLGGEDFTDRLVTWALREQGLEPEPTEMREPLRVARLREQCERAKRVLATGEARRVEFVLPDARGEIGEDAPRLSVDTERFRALAADLVERLKGPVGRVLRDGRTHPSEVDDVILVGGATRMDFVTDVVRELFGKEPRATFNPDEVVAYGAAVQSALIEDDSSVEDMVMTDVCPFTLGIETSRRLGADLRDGYFMPVIHRNTTIPVSREVTVYTVYPNQRSMTVHVFQGEARRVKDNLQIGELEVKNIPLGPEEQEVRIRFTYDLNGILEVEAVVSETGRRFQTVLTHNVKGLSKQEVRRAVKNLQRLKFYPRDELVHRQLLLFAERVVGEIDPYRRDDLEHVLAAFEHAMHAGDREVFGEMRQALLVTLSSLGFAFEPEAMGGDGGDTRAA